MKRLLAFVVLLALGIVALRLAIGDETAVRANTPNAVRDPARQPARPPGVSVQQGRTNATVSQTGRLELPRWRDVPLGDGRVRKEEVFVLRAEDSQPVGEGLQQLIGVTLSLFDDGELAATVTAREAFVILGRDDNGRPQIDAQQEIDLRDTVVVTEPGARAASLRLELGDARVDIGESVMQLTTGPDQPVRLVVDGDRRVTLTGRGAQARLPRQSDSGLRRADVEILREPVLVTEDLRVESAGRLRYVEDTVTGAAQITLDEDVRLDLTRGLSLTGLDGADTAADAGRAAVRGDQFTAWLQRAAGRPADGTRAGDGVLWQRLELAGAPATVQLPGLRVETPRVTVLPGPLGDPHIVTAHGGESRVVQTERSGDGSPAEPLIGTSPRRIHLLRPGDGCGALLRQFGFPRWTLRSLDQQQIVAFEGDSSLTSGTRSLSASRGLRAFRRGTGTGVVAGAGDVRVVRQQPSRPDLVATGNDGLRLVMSAGREHLQVGPAHAAGPAGRQHRYEVRYGEARLRGAGSCTIERTVDSTSVTLAAPHDEIEADLPARGIAVRGAELRQVHQLHAAFAGRQLTELDVGGLPVRATILRADERLLAQAPRLLLIGPRSLRLLPIDRDEAPWNELPQLERLPRLLRVSTAGSVRDPSANAPSATGPSAIGADREAEQTVEVVGPRIDVHHAGGRQVLIDAHAVADELPRLYARLPQSGASEATTITCAAERLRILPFVLAPQARRSHLAGAIGPLADVIFHSSGRPWLLVEQVRDFQLDDERQGHVEGTGRQLFLSQGGAAALFVGDPDRLEPAVVTRSQGGRTIAMSGAAVRVYRDDEVRLAALGAFADRSTFVAPTMTLHESDRTGLLSHMRAICRGNIDVDSAAVRFGGPVAAQGLTPAGDEDPDGVGIDAAELVMRRQPTTGEVVFVAGRDVDLRWTRLDARAAEIDLDVLRNRCLVRDPAGATVELPDGRALSSTRMEINYDTWSVSMGRGRITQRARTGAEQQ